MSDTATTARQGDEVTGESPWPNLFIVGASRAGTTSLSRYLGAHPEIFMTPFKEPHFFSGHRHPLLPFVHDQNAYLRLFAGAREPVRGEASTSYLANEAAAVRIKEVSPDARILIALRDPVDRAYSVFWRRVRTGLERRSFAAAVAQELDPGFGEPSSYAWSSRYAGNVRRFLRVFGPNVRIVVFEELIRDVPRELAGVFAFLGVDAAVAERIPPEKHNPFAMPRNRLAARLLGSSRARRVGRALVPFALREPLERRLVETRAKPPIDRETERLLIEFFAPDVRELATLLGRSLPWPRWS